MTVSQSTAGSQLGGTARLSPQTHVAATAFLSLFSIVGFALYGLPFFYDFFVSDLGWTRQQVTSGNAYSKLLVGPLFGFLAGWFIDRFGPRRLMLAGILMALQLVHWNPLDGVEILSAGRWRMVHTNAIAYGFLANAFLGALHWAVPRLTLRPVASVPLSYFIFCAWQARPQ